MNTFRRLIASTILGLGLLLGTGHPAAAETTATVVVASEDDMMCVLIGFLIVEHGDHYDVYAVFLC
jgi:hypothetical protein